MKNVESGPNNISDVNILNNGAFLWGILVIVIALMSYGIYLTHPIQKHLFEGNLLATWIFLNIIVIPVGFIFHYLAHNNIVAKNLGADAKVKGGPMLGEKTFATTEGFAEGCLVFASSDFALLAITIVGAVAALVAGVIFAPLLLVVEYIVTKLADIDMNKYGEIHWLVMLTNELVILYATYFMAIFIANKFLG